MSREKRSWVPQWLGLGVLGSHGYCAPLGPFPTAALATPSPSVATPGSSTELCSVRDVYSWDGGVVTMATRASPWERRGMAKAVSAEMDNNNNNNSNNTGSCAAQRWGWDVQALGCTDAHPRVGSMDTSPWGVCGANGPVTPLSVPLWH